MNSIFKLIKLIFAALGLFIEKDNTLTQNKNGEQEVLTCNNKPVLAQPDNNKIFNKKSFIFLNVFEQNTTNCSYLTIKRLALSQLSSKMNLLIRKQLKPKIKALINKDKTTYAKWSKLNEIIEQQPLQNFLIDFQIKVEYVKVKKTSYMVEVDNSDYVSQQLITTVIFPIYQLLKEMQAGYLFGIELTYKDIQTLKTVYEDIFKDINDTANYRFPNKDKFIKNHDRRLVLVEDTLEAQPLRLIEIFMNIANKLDIKLNNQGLQDQMFNLLIDDDILQQVQKYKNSNENFESKHDSLAEYKESHKVDLKSLNDKLNKEAISNTIQQNKKINSTSKHRKYKRREQKITGFNNTKMLSFEPILSNNIILDPTNLDFQSYIPILERLRHTYLLGGSGSGKTTLLESLIYNDIQDEESCKIIFDIHGKNTKRIAQFIKNKTKFILIDPYLDGEQTFITNPLYLKDKTKKSIDLRTKAIVNAFKIALDIDWSINMEAVLVPCIATLLRKEYSDIYELQRFMNKDINMDLVELGITSPIKGHRRFFETQFHQDKLDVTKDAISTKLQVFLNDPIFSNATTGISTIDLDKEINTKGNIIIIKLSEDQNLLARLLLEMIQEVVRKRHDISDGEIVEKVHTHLYLDEFQNYLTPTIEKILTESRNYYFYVTFAHQSIIQLDKKMAGMVLSNTNIKIIGNNAYDDIKKMSKEIQVDVEQLENLKQGEFLLKVGVNSTIKIKSTDRFIDQTIDKDRWNELVEYQLETHYTAINNDDDDIQDDNNNDNETDDLLTRLNSDLDFEIKEF